jgi:riboflavin kinase/FMN adenylyltransferase
MRYFHGTTQFYSEQPTAVTLGKFDGLHLGHQKLIGQITAQRSSGLSPVVFVIAPPNIPRLLTRQEMYQKLADCGVDCLIECPYEQEILGMSPEQFLETVLVQKLKAKYLAVGSDFRFGHHRSGDVQFLASRQEQYGMRVDIIEKACLGGREISSTYVREAMKCGDMELVSSLLGSPFSVSGTVQHGRQLGRRIGMPTLNLIPEQGKLLPPNGVYYTKTHYGAQIYNGMTNIGSKPTVDGSFIGVETYLYDFSEDFYGKEIKVELLTFRRPEQKFESVDALKAQMENDIRAGEEYFREH